ncbi:MAG: hypothetical protein WBM90_00700, partial [Acidimicrobiia bacterium]
LALLAFLMAFVGLLFFVVLPALPEAAGAGASGIPQKPEAFIFGAQQVAGQAWWFAVILATAILGGEVASTVWATSLTRDSRRIRHISVRFLIFTIASWLAFLVGTIVWAAITWFAAEGSGGPEIGESLGLLWKFLVIAAAWTSIGLGAVAVTRSIAVAMGVALGISFVDSIVAPFVELYEKISLTAASNGIFEVAGDGPFSDFIPGGDMSTAHALGVMIGWAVVFLALTWWGLQRRDA